MKAVLDTRVGSGYDDDVTSRYHFPNRYLPAAERALGDWIVYREPRRGGGREGYVAVARLARLEPDPARPGFTYARLTDYLPFDAVVPLRRGAAYHEGFLDQVADPGQVGAAMQGKSIRGLTEAEFGAIVRAGLRETLDPGNAVRLELDPDHLDEPARALVQAPPEEQERRVVQILVNRKLRDAAFRRAVVDAYDGRCAVTRLRLINGGGKAEAQAAHILPVAAGDPDVVQNGIALSATVHWLFDRHLIALTDDYGLLVSHNRVPAELRALFERQMSRIHLPADPTLHPHLGYVRQHRQRFAAG